MSGRRRRERLTGRSNQAATEAHVRLYRHELECPAYRTLSPAARVLLIELRSLYDVKRGDNRVYCGVRQIMERCNLTQRTAQRARDELIERGWITAVERGNFNRKVRHATVYALEHEPPNSGNGSVASKSFMRWSPPVHMKKVGSEIDYRTVVESTTDEFHNPEKVASTVAESATDRPTFEKFTVAESTTQIGLPTEGGLSPAPLNFTSAETGARRDNVIPIWRTKRVALVARGILPRDPVRLAPAAKVKRTGRPPKFSPEQIAVMRSMLATGETMAAIGQHFGTSAPNVHRLIGAHRVRRAA